MKKVFTFLLAFMLVANFAMAQNASVTINGNTYEAQGAAFGPSACGLSASGALGIIDDGADPVTDGCEAATNDLTDLVAIVDRGACNFSLKCYNAQTAGAIAVVVCNNVDDAIITMAAGDLADDVVVPCVMVSRADCETFRMDVGATIDIQSVTVENDPNDNVIWEDNGFDGGTGEWTTNSISCGNGADGVDMWTWTADGSVPGSCGGGQITAPTFCNGAMGMSSDYLDSGDGDCGTGGGACGAPQVAELVSPVIDLTNAGVSGVSLKWWQNARHFTNSTYIVSFTTDSGETWNDIPVNADYVVNDPAVNDVRRVFLPGAVGNNIQVKFRYEANYYYWIVDDVQIVETEANNLQVDPFFAVPTNAVVPAHQVEPVYFLADVRNVGSQTQENVNLNMTITNEAGETVYTDDLAYGAIDAAMDVQNIPFNNAWTPSGETGTFTGTYTISADEADFDETNNVQSFTMTVSDSTYATENGSTRYLLPGDGNWDEGAPRSWGMGNVYHVTNETFLTTVTVEIGNRTPGLVGQGVTIWLYEWTDEGTIPDGTVQASERTRVAFTQITFDGDGGGDPASVEYTVPLIDFATSELGPVALKADTDYIVFMEYTDTDPAPDTDTDFELVAGDEIDYAAQIFMNSPFAQDADGNDLGLGIGSPRYSMVLAIPMDGSFATDIDFGTAGFGREIAPVARMNVSQNPGTSTEILSDDNVINVFPNPVSDRMTVELDFVNTTDKMAVKIVNTRGQEMMTQEYTNVKTQTLSLDVSGYTAGTYYISIATDKGVKMKKFIVQR